MYAEQALVLPECVASGDEMNKLYFGDNLDVLREYIDPESVDLIYLDPPFNSQARYNVLFESAAEDRTSAQVEAFRDTWAWGDEAEANYEEVLALSGATARFVSALHSALGRSDMMAYLTMMALRLHELHRVLKPSGSLYLHCDPTASHYLKVLLDSIFKPNNFRSEIVWRRTPSHNKLSSSIWTNTRHPSLLFQIRRVRVPSRENALH